MWRWTTSYARWNWGWQYGSCEHSFQHHVSINVSPKQLCWVHWASNCWILTGILRNSNIESHQFDRVGRLWLLGLRTCILPSDTATTTTWGHPYRSIRRPRVSLFFEARAPCAPPPLPAPRVVIPRVGRARRRWIQQTNWTDEKWGIYDERMFKQICKLIAKNNNG